MNSRVKGKNGELECMHLLRDFYGYDVRRGYASCGEPDLIGLKGIHIECKRNERLNIYEAIEQSRRDSEKMKDGAPVVIHRKSRKPWLVTMDLELFMDMYGTWSE